MSKLEVSAVKLRNVLQRTFPNAYKPLFSSAIITAGGSGTRMGGVSKQVMLLCGKPCILYSLKAFQDCPEISEIIVVARDGEIEEIRRICRENNISKLSSVVLGGSTRQESVANGFARVSPKCDLVAIHDAARPLVLPRHISKLLSLAQRYGASCAAKRISDTVKRSKNDEIVCETVPRDDLYSVQTPQVFKSDLYRISVALAEKDGFQVTDDCSLAEHAGFPIKLCEIGSPNFKLTTPEDIETITSILRERSNG